MMPFKYGCYFGYLIWILGGGNPLFTGLDRHLKPLSRSEHFKEERCRKRIPKKLGIRLVTLFSPQRLWKTRSQLWTQFLGCTKMMTINSIFVSLRSNRAQEINSFLPTRVWPAAGCSEFYIFVWPTKLPYLKWCSNRGIRLWYVFSSCCYSFAHCMYLIIL